jgi:hypothetical protein
MPSTYLEATEQIFQVVTTAWNSGAAAIAGSTPPLYYPGDEPAGTEDGSNFYARISIQTVMDGQITLSNAVGVVGHRRFETLGIIAFQLFCPQSIGNSYHTGRKLAILVRDAYRGATTQNGVWFLNARIRELPPEDVLHKFSVLVNFRYDDVG